MRHIYLGLGCLLALSAPALAQAEHDNLRGIRVCVDDESFTADVGELDGTSQNVAQSLYDYFVARMQAEGLEFDESGEQPCQDWAVNLHVTATDKTPRAWLMELLVLDHGAYASLDEGDQYLQPVTIWSDGVFGVRETNQGLDAYLIREGKGAIDAFIKAYKSAN